ncbi:hypothetical protein G6F62_013733 [Rhizopus arrhizus]|nr:hypothetical protein G6F62_013733 [Rhizopus arrhizus]
MRAGAVGIRIAPHRPRGNYLRRQRRLRFPRRRARTPAGAFQDGYAGRLRHRRHARWRLRGRRAAALCGAHPVAGAGPRAKPVGRAPWPVRVAGPGDPPQPGTDANAVGRRFAYAVLAAGWLPHAHGQPAAAPVAAPSAARKRAGTGAPASHLRAAGRPHGRRTDVRFGRPAGSAARGAECLPRHRTHRRTPGAALGAPA